MCSVLCVNAKTLYLCVCVLMRSLSVALCSLRPVMAPLSQLWFPSKCIADSADLANSSGSGGAPAECGRWIRACCVQVASMFELGLRLAMDADGVLGIGRLQELSSGTGAKRILVVSVLPLSSSTACAQQHQPCHWGTVVVMVTV